MTSSPWAGVHPAAGSPGWRAGGRSISRRRTRLRNAKAQPCGMAVTESHADSRENCAARPSGVRMMAALRPDSYRTFLQAASVDHGLCVSMSMCRSSATLRLYRPGSLSFDTGNRPSAQSFDPLRNHASNSRFADDPSQGIGTADSCAHWSIVARDLDSRRQRRIIPDSTNIAMEFRQLNATAESIFFHISPESTGSSPYANFRRTEIPANTVQSEGAASTSPWPSTIGWRITGSTRIAWVGTRTGT
jgi:hypothetical protein